MQPFETNSVDEKEFLEKSNPKPKLKILKIVLIISFIIVSLAIVGVILFFIFKKDNETHPMEKEEDKKEEEESEIETETKEEESEIENETEEEEIYEKEEEKEEEIKEEEEEQDIDHSIGKIICKYKISSINKPIQILSTDYLKRSDFNIYINNKKIITFKTSDDKVWENKIIEGIKLADEENKKIFSIRSKPQGKKERKQREEKLFNQIKSFNQFLMKREQDKYNDENLTRNVITQTHLKIEEISNYVNKENLTPTVMFVFSIKKIDEYAKMLSKTQFITDGEKSRIIKFFDKCIKKLTPEDQKIGQIQFLRNLLQSGVGIHHSGLLPILKEIVEILYSKNLIKILFATTSFSIGLNMPTKSVVFTDIFKFNEGKNEFLSSSESSNVWESRKKRNR
jgi:hypothetical protein